MQNECGPAECGGDIALLLLQDLLQLLLDILWSSIAHAQCAARWLLSWNKRDAKQQQMVADVFEPRERPGQKAEGVAQPS